MLRLASTSAVRRAIASPKLRFLSTALNASIHETPAVSHRRFSTNSDTAAAHSKVIGALASEIKSQELSIMKSRGAPENLPFTIEDDPSYCHVMLTKDFGEEKMEVTVSPVHVEDVSSVYINVSLSKEAKGTLDLGACVSADKIVINRVSFSEPNNYYCTVRYYVGEADVDLQNGLREFVKSRGIEKSSVGFLCRYMGEKRKSWGTVWNPEKKSDNDLKNLKKFVEEW